MFRILCGQCMALALILSSLILGCQSQKNSHSSLAFLDTSWVAYKETFLRPEGYVWDEARQEVTSEGQSYALLRAVWMRDKETFYRVFNWTEAHLARPDGLYSWQWTPKDGGRVLDANTATDADQDIAFALILAAKAFNMPEYRDRAKALITAIRQIEGIPVDGGWIPSAGNWAVSNRIINFSYFTFYAYPHFATLDPEGDWLGVRERCYDVLTRFLEQKNVLLPADFAILDKSGHFVPLAEKGRLSGDFSFDAMRVYWRVAVDCLLNNFPRACSDPARTTAIVDILARDGALYTQYSVTGVKKSDVTSISFYGSILPALKMYSPQLATALVNDKLSPANLASILRNPDHYYDNNWTWFGLAAWAGHLTAMEDDMR
ncbi:glycosyl hydrolase family 8 [Desulfovibrio inopinatus]|uniref:glycosyl hydrolase family 8 n=1 Tax=Desulfovibrio inopinatus TaxID=102109 RepID=UPI000420948D|nr:glycosyl hydrolase family 8 [Desulfovibrio inopinatus]